MQSLTVPQEDIARLSARFSDFRHSLNNALAVMMALAEMSQRDLAHAPKLASTVLAKSGETIDLLRLFTEDYNRLFRPDKSVQG